MTTAASPTPTVGKTESSARPLLIAGAIFLAVMAGSFVFLRMSTPEPTANPRPGGSVNQTRKPDEAAQKRANSSPTTARADGHAQAELQRERLLETVGSVNSIQLYQSYLNVGLLADAVKNGAYTKTEAAELLGINVALLKTVDAQMQKLENIGLDEEEVAAVKQVRTVSALLKAQAGHLQNHWTTGEKSSLDEFQKARRESWLELRITLGLGSQDPS